MLIHGQPSVAYFYQKHFRNTLVAVHQCTSVYILELRVFAKQKLGMAFLHRHPWRYWRRLIYNN